mgnify:CR=1 FL=1
MYNFIFCFFYHFFERKKKFKSIFVATSIVGLAAGLHLVLLYSIIKKIIGFDFEFSVSTYGERKYFLIVFALVFFLILYFAYYRNKGQEILAECRGQQFLNIRNGAYIIAILFLPLIMILLLN